MSFSWKGLLGVGGAGASSNATASTLADPLGKSGILDEKSVPWDLQEDVNVPNMLGMRNFGNTCYVNSVIQALYFCRPFRESLLAYSAALAASSKDPAASSGEADNDAKESTASTSQTTQQQLDEASFFDALRLLFSQMVSSTIPPAPVETASTPAPPSTSSYLASGLSRKTSVKPLTGKVAQTLSSSASLPSTMLAPSFSAIIPPPLTQSIANNRIVNSCSNIVVEDDDIRKFLGILKKSNVLFDTTTHQDAHELLNFVLNRVGEDVFEEAKADGRAIQRSNRGEAGSGKISVVDVKAGGQTWVHRVFEGVLTNETRCLTCETVTSRDECFLDLSIDIARNSSVTSCLRQFSASEMLCARNKFFCDTCSSLQEAEKRMKVKKLPNVLALHLKRFKYEEDIQRYVKLAYRVVFPFELRLFNTSDDAQDPDKLYELFAIIVHIGVGPHHGHYITIVKVGKRWFVFDDETVNIIDEADICRYYGDTPGAGSAYVLFYQAVDLNMQDLGLPDTTAEKQRAREKAEEALWQQYMMQQQQQQQQQQHNASVAKSDMPTLKVDLSRLPSSLTSPLQTSPTPSDSMTNEYRSAGMSPNTSSTGGGIGSTASALFNRKNGTNPVSINSAIANNGETPTESKSSWFSSLRSGSAKKPTGSQAGSGVAPAPLSGSSPPKPVKQTSSSGLAPAERPDDSETASISTSSSTRPTYRDTHHGPQHTKGAGFDLMHHTPTKAGATVASSSDLNHLQAPDMMESMPISAQTSPGKGAKQPLQGAAWAPADRPLSKKEQDKIAKQSRRSSVTAASLSPQTSVQAPNGKDLVTGAPVVELNGGASLGKKSSVRRPSTADPSLDGQQSFAHRRRTTLSRTFGFGRKGGADKQ